MAEILEINNKTEKVMYAFRFTTSNKSIHLNQKQLDSIPYLSAIVAHEHDFLSTRNENGEYLLNSPIQYTWFMPILHSLISKQPYTLFTELPENEDILGILQLFDYLGVKSFDLPSLKEHHLVLSNPSDDNNNNIGKSRVEYHKANLMETRNTAAEFIIAISKNVYNLLDADTLNSIADLILIILSNTDVFSSQFRQHTLAIAKECCFTFFSKKQQRRLFTTHYNTQKYRKLNSLMYLYDDNNSLPDHFSNAFTWKGLCIPTENDGISILPASSETMVYSFEDEWFIENSVIDDTYIRTERSRISDELRELELRLIQINDELKRLKEVELQLIKKIDELKRSEQVELEEKKKEAKLIRSKYFNTCRKPQNIDKFKHRSGPKAQKYR